MAGTMQFLAWLVVATCLLPGVSTTQHHAGQPMDSAGVGGGLQEPEVLEVMFEVFPPAWDMRLLWAGLKLNVMRQLYIQDKELASTHPGRRLRLLLHHHVPSDLKGAKQQLQQFQNLQKGPPLSPSDFKHLLLTGLSCVHQLHEASEAEERGHWAQVFILLAQETLWDLCKDFCPQGQPLLWGPGPQSLTPSPDPLVSHANLPLPHPSQAGISL